VQIKILYSISGFDSFAAAYCAWLKYENAADYQEVLYSQVRRYKSPKIFVDFLNLDGDEVFVLGIPFFSREILDEIDSRCKLTIVSNKRFITGCEALTIGSDKQAACQLSWELFGHKDKKQPLLFSTIYDCEYTSGTEHSRLVLRNMGTYSYKFYLWKKALAALDSNPLSFAQEGKAIERAFQGNIDRHLCLKHEFSMGNLKGCAVNAHIMYHTELFNRINDTCTYDLVVLYYTLSKSLNIAFSMKINNTDSEIIQNHFFGNSVPGFNPNRCVLPYDKFYNAISNVL